MPNTHVAFIFNDDGTATRIAVGTEEHCRRIMDERDATGGIRRLTEDELR